jgi:hypothetical protein
MLSLTPPAHLPKSSPFVAAACLTLVAMSLSGAALAADEGSALENMLVRDSKVTLQLRTYFFDKLNPAPKNNNQAWAIGGWLDYQSG